MTDREKWGLRGLVKSLHTEDAELALASEQWMPPWRHSLTLFREDGMVSEQEHHNRDGSVSRTINAYDETGKLVESLFEGSGGHSTTVYSYDEAGRPARIADRSEEGAARDREVVQYGPDGRRTRIYYVPPEIVARGGAFGYCVEGSDHSYTAQGAAEITTIYDAQDRAAEVLFHNGRRELICRVGLEYDSEGRLMREVQSASALSLFRNGVAARLIGPLILRSAGLSDHISSTSYEYDAQGRRTAKQRSMGKVMQERTTYRYDEFGNKVEEAVEHASREIRPGARPVNEQRRKHDVRYEYQYDDHRNWIEKLVSTRPEPNPNFQPTSVERRRITYWR